MMRVLVGQSVIYGLATIVSRGASVILLLVLPFMIGPHDYGALSMIATISTLIVTVAPMEVTQGLAHYLPKVGEHDKPRYSGAAIYCTILGLCAFAAIGLAAAEPLNRLVFGSPSYLTVYRLGILLIVMNGLFYFVQNQLRWEFRHKNYAILSLAFSLLNVALALSFARFMKSPLQGVVIGQIVATAVATTPVLWRLRRSFALALDRAKLRQLLRVSLPIVPATLAMFLSNYASRFVLNGMTSLTQVGQFAFASQVAGISLLPILGIQTALTPLIMAHHTNSQTARTIGRLFEIFAVCALALALLLGLFAPEIVHLLGRREYGPGAKLVIVLAPSILISQTYVFAPGFLISGKTIRQMWVSMAGAAISLGLNVMLIPRFGLLGAAAATLISATSFAVLWFALSRKFYDVPVRWGRTFALVVPALIVASATLHLPWSMAVLLVVKAAIVLGSLIAGCALGLLPARDLWTQAQTLARRLSQSGNHRTDPET